MPRSRCHPLHSVLQIVVAPFVTVIGHADMHAYSIYVPEDRAFAPRGLLEDGLSASSILYPHTKRFGGPLRQGRISYPTRSLTPAWM